MRLADAKEVEGHVAHNGLHGTHADDAAYAHELTFSAADVFSQH
jgi:hypothetical protein